MTPAEYALTGVIVALSACVQASVGFGYALLASPLLALFAPQLVPGPVMLSSMVLSAAAGLSEAKSIDRGGVGWALVGRVPGALLAGLLLVSVAPQMFSVVFAVSVLAAVAMSVIGVRVVITPRSLVLAGVVSGLMATLSSIGGPPMAMLFQHEQGPKLRATLNTYFALGGLITLPVLSWAGRFGVDELLAGLAMLPACGVGLLLARSARSWLDGGHTRSAVLALAALSASAVLVQTLLR